MLSRKAAIVGIGATDFSKDSGRSELRLAARRCWTPWTTPGFRRRTSTG